MDGVLAIYNQFNRRFEGAWSWENSCSLGIWLEGCDHGGALSGVSSDCAILLSRAGEDTLSACPCTPGWTPITPGDRAKTVQNTGTACGKGPLG